MKDENGARLKHGAAEVDFAGGPDGCAEGFYHGGVEGLDDPFGGIGVEAAQGVCDGEVAAGAVNIPAAEEECEGDCAGGVVGVGGGEELPDEAPAAEAGVDGDLCDAGDGEIANGGAEGFIVCGEVGDDAAGLADEPAMGGHFVVVALGLEALVVRAGEAGGEEGAELRVERGVDGGIGQVFDGREHDF